MTALVVFTALVAVFLAAACIADTRVGAWCADLIEGRQR